MQKKMQSPERLVDALPQFIDTHMPAQHADFYSGLAYFSLGTLDSKGRPWATVLVTESNLDSSVGIGIAGDNALSVKAVISRDDPFCQALIKSPHNESNPKRLFAGVGIDFTNRRRNKLAGVIEQVELEAKDHLNLRLHSNEHLGNCPKYITVRELVPKQRTPETVFNHKDCLDIPLPQYCKDHINKISTAFLATKHSVERSANNSPAQDWEDMGFNHRGGAPGFIRLFEQQRGNEVCTYLVLPDFSGNRFYQSLGNIQTDKPVGLALPDFTTGDMLYVTGEAENLFGIEAQQLMPRVSLLTKIKLTGAVFIKQAIHLELAAAEQFSPYNPPLRYLKNELEHLGHYSQLLNNATDRQATLRSVKTITPSIATFTFSLDKPIAAPIPGGFCVLSFAGLINAGYSHMNESNPQLVNEDYIRTWTISSSPTFNAEQKQFNPVDTFDVTVKLKADGLISPYLHQQSQANTLAHPSKMKVLLNGVGGDFSCFQQAKDGQLTIPPSMLWFAGGVGITPFMSMWSGIAELAKHAPKLASDIVLVFAGREEDAGLLNHFLTRNSALPSSVSITVMAYLTNGSNQPNAIALDSIKQNQGIAKINHRRLQAEDLGDISQLRDRDSFICGPEGLSRSVRQWLQLAKVDSNKIHEESFGF